jgi:hypothetical protein
MRPKVQRSEREEIKEGEIENEKGKERSESKDRKQRGVRNTSLLCSSVHKFKPLSSPQRPFGVGVSVEKHT